MPRSQGCDFHQAFAAVLELPEMPGADPPSSEIECLCIEEVHKKYNPSRHGIVVL